MSEKKDDIVLAVKKYLAFSEENQEVESEIAAETADMMLKSENNEPGAINNLSFEQKVLLAANNCIRHNYTSYDDRFIEQTIEQSYPEDLEIANEIEEIDEVAEFLRLRRK